MQRRPRGGAGGDRAGRASAGGRPASRTIFFLDEIHRFNKAQQDALLPAVEEGLVTLIGATTENPYFEVNSALLSRSPDLRAAPLTGEQVAGCCARALADAERGIADPPRSPTRRSSSSPRAPAATRAPRSNALELAAETAARRGGRVDAGGRPRTRCSARRSLYDKGGDKHYDYISAWIKATRGSDLDASLYYLAVMLEGGEDPRFIARRMVMLASEDIGNADPQALSGGRGGGRRSSTWACPSARSTCPGGDLPRAGAEVERRRTAIAAARARRPRARRRAAARVPAGRALPGRPQARARGAATSTRTTCPAGCPTSRCCPTRSRASASTSRPTAAGRASAAAAAAGEE